MQKNLEQPINKETIVEESKKIVSEFYKDCYDKEGNYKRRFSTEEISRRYDLLNKKDREKIERLLIDFSEQNHPRMLTMLKVTGREREKSFIENLEEKHNCKLDNLKIASDIFSITENFHYIDMCGERDYKEVSEKLDEIIERAKELENIEIEATHVTGENDSQSIDKTGAIIKSSSEESKQYLGDGVYVGMLGCYRDWNEEGKMYTMKVFMKDVVPLMCGHEEPEAQANILSSIKIYKDGERINVNKKSMEWKFDQFPEDIRRDWRVVLLEEKLNTEIDFLEDEKGKSYLTGKVNEPPIIWGSLCYALHIRNFIPKGSEKEL